jgi:post-segregation antitoxin (ccd killing protein)
MGRPSKPEQEKKVKISISVDKNLYEKIKSDNLKPSRIIERLLKEYYEN